MIMMNSICFLNFNKERTGKNTSKQRNDLIVYRYTNSCYKTCIKIKIQFELNRDCIRANGNFK